MPPSSSSTPPPAAASSSDPERGDRDHRGHRDVRDERDHRDRDRDGGRPSSGSHHGLTKRRSPSARIDPKKLPSEISVLEIRVGLVRKVCVSFWVL